MAALHPFFVHFPIALLMVAVLFDLYGVLRKVEHATSTAFTLQLMAGVAAIFVAISGNAAESVIVGQGDLHSGVLDTFNRHVSLGNIMIWVIIIFALVRTFSVLEKKEWALGGWIFPVASIGLAALILVTGLLGGELSRQILAYFKMH